MNENYWLRVIFYRSATVEPVVVLGEEKEPLVTKLKQLGSAWGQVPPGNSVLSPRRATAGVGVLHAQFTYVRVAASIYVPVVSKSVSLSHSSLEL